MTEQQSETPEPVDRPRRTFSRRAFTQADGTFSALEHPPASTSAASNPSDGTEA
jgi:hypothetical protein